MWEDQEYKSNSLPTKANSVGGIFIMVIIKQSAIFLAKVDNLALKCYTHFNNHAELFKHFCSIMKAVDKILRPTIFKICSVCHQVH